MKYFLGIIITILFSIRCSSQERSFVSGNVTDENDNPLENVSVQILSSKKGIITAANGTFKIAIKPNKATALIFSSTGYKTVQKNFTLNAGEEEKVTIIMQKKVVQLSNVTVTNEGERKEAGRVIIDADKSLLNPSPVIGIESLIKVFVGSNNELTSQYSVRGGNYDENLIYVNDFEVFRPYLVSNGQQEGLSFINPELTANVKFYNGGFQAKYGDKMSSALDITYNNPRREGGSVYASLLEQGLHLEGVSKNNRFSYLIGARNRNNKNLLNSQETQGNYVPSSSDVQALLGYQLSQKWKLESFINLSQTKFTFIPESAELTSAVFTPYYTEDLGLNISYSGQEKDQYGTTFIGFSAINQPNKKLRLKWMVNYFNDKEIENKDITGSYVFGEIGFDQTQSTIVNPLGSGVFQTHGRDNLNISVWNASHKGSYEDGNHFIQWGQSIEKQIVNDNIDQWELNDSAGYSLPYNSSSSLQLQDVEKGNANLNILRLSGYVQDNIRFKDSSDFTLQIGMRYNYNDLNNEWLVSPRTGISFKPKNWKKDIVFKAALGIYDQPPFFRELVKPDGTLNTSLKSEKSWQASTGFDYNFSMFERPAKVSTEAYYKQLWDVDPYDIDNVQISYFGTNNARAYAAGFETRLYTEFVKDAQSWLSLGIMKTMEKIDNFYYYNYTNKEGQIIGSTTTDKVVTDSIKTNTGWFRRPTDRRITLGMFYQDYLSTNKNFKFYLNMLYGSNLPYNIPGSVKYRNALIIDPYIRVDVGFSALLLDLDKSNRRSHSPFRNFESIWATLEVFNLIDHANTISYMLIKDYQNNIYTMPNTLTPRMLNFKIVAKW